MKIGFDGKRATNNLTGLGNYSRSLISQLAYYFPQNQYFVYSSKIKSATQIANFLKAGGIELIRPASIKFLWRLLGIRKQLINDNITVFHGLSHEIPVGLRSAGIASVVTVHDLIFLKFPEYFNVIDRLIYTIKCRYACSQADSIIAVSERTKADVVQLFRVEPSKIKVIYQSCDESFKSVVPTDRRSAVARKYNLPSKFLLSVGTIEARKNLKTLIKAIPAVTQGLKLVVVGKRTPYYQEVQTEIKMLGLEERIIFLEDVAFQDLPAIYQMSSVFIYPSLYEGFGIPIIEALHSGVPVVAAKGSCLEEAGGPHSIYVDPLNAQEFSTAINHVLDPQNTQKMISKGFEYVQQFDNEIFAEQIINLYKDLSNIYQNTKHA